ncbi:MarR family winged helix-turn-helix transcriptional regulator [Prauserella cavernicola]|uniref:MarR family transcriptional regulator n=1 Tax=Prauserella cavernicola TaxID=2800127 RepID=A0A934QT33_9PSEU|nr:MarR family transcriptional regulator [Prauserella cavernicola]MBK1784883.1 MarR family transcriptional regulator [Prauserella cavernicola]
MTDSLPQLVSRLLDQVLAGLHEHLAGHGFPDLRPTHVVNVLARIDCDGSRPTALASRAGMTTQAISELVAYLERAGYVRRVPDPKDGRARVVVFADRGEQAAKVAAEYFEELEHRGAREVGAERFADVKAALAQLTRADRP